MPGSEKTEVSLPKATLIKIIRENLPKDLRISGDTMKMLLESSTEFVKLLSSEANDISAREKKNIINPEHVMSALNSLGFESFVPEVQEAWDAWKEENKEKAVSSKSSNIKTAADAAGYTEEEQIQMQQELLAGALIGTGLMPNPYTHSPSLETDIIKEKKDKELPLSISEFNVSSPAPPESKTTSSAFIDSSLSFLKSFDVQINKSLSKSQSSIEKTDLSFSEMAAKTDILPIKPLSIPTLPSSFYPELTPHTDSDLLPKPIPSFLSTHKDAPVSPSGSLPSKSFPININQISLAQPIYIEQEGVCHAVTWGSILRELAKMPLMREMVNSHQRQKKAIQDQEELDRAAKPSSLKSCPPSSIQVPLPSSKKEITPITKGSGTSKPSTTAHHNILTPSLSMEVTGASGKEISQKSPSLSSSVGKGDQQGKGVKDALDLEIEELRKKRAERKKEKKALKMTGGASKEADADKKSGKLGGAKDDSPGQIGGLAHPELKKLTSDVGQEGATKKSGVFNQLEKDETNVLATSLPTSLRTFLRTSLPTSIEFLPPPIRLQAKSDVINTSIPATAELIEIGGEPSEEKVTRKEKRRHDGNDEDLDEYDDGSHKRLKSDH